MKHVIAASLICIASGSLAPAQAQDSFQNMSDATGDSVEASGRVAAAGGQVALGAVAVPLALVGAGVESSGNAANVIAGDLWDAANAPLVVDEDIAMAQPLPDVPRVPQTAMEAEGE